MSAPTPWTAEQVDAYVARFKQNVNWDLDIPTPFEASIVELLTTFASVLREHSEGKWARVLPKRQSELFFAEADEPSPPAPAAGPELAEALTDEWLRSRLNTGEYLDPNWCATIRRDIIAVLQSWLAARDAAKDATIAALEARLRR